MEPTVVEHIPQVGRGHSMSLLPGLEKVIPPGLYHHRRHPRPNTQKPLPPTPAAPASISTGDSASNTTLHNSLMPKGSLPSDLDKMNTNSQAQDSDMQRLNGTISTRSPVLGEGVSSIELPRVQSELLVPRVYSPMLLDPSSSLTTVSTSSSRGRQKAENPVISHLATINWDEELWRTLPPSQAQPVSFAPVPPRLLSPRSFDSLSPNPKSTVPWRARSSSPVQPRSYGRPNVTHQREASKAKVLEHLGINEDGQPVDTRGRKRAKRPVGPRSTDYDHYTPGSKSGKSVVKAGREAGHPDEPGWEDCSGDDDYEGSYVLSAEYHSSLVEQYRALAPPLVGQWDDSSDDEDEVQTYRFVPKPLFWKSRSRSEPMDAQRHDGVVSTGRTEVLRGRRRPSSTSTPFKTMLTGHFKRSSAHEDRTAAGKYSKISNAFLLRSRKEKTTAAKPISARSAQMSVAAVRGNLTKNQPTLTLQLPQSLASDQGRDLFPRSVYRRCASCQEPLDSPVANDQFAGGSPKQQSASAQRLVRRSSPSNHTKSSSGGATTSSKSVYSQAYTARTTSLSGQYSRPVIPERPRSPPERADMTVRSPSVPLKVHATGYTTGLKQAFKRISPIRLSHHSIEFKPSLFSHDASSHQPGGKSSRDPYNAAVQSSVHWYYPDQPDTKGHEGAQISDADPEKIGERRGGGHTAHRKLGFGIGRFLDKNAEGRSESDEEEMEKWRNELKASIRLVGEADPVHDVEFTRKRETFGAGWL